MRGSARLVRFVVILVVLTTALGGRAHTQPLKVGVAGSPPWVVRTPGGKGLDGFSIRLWQAVAAKLNLTYDFVEMRTLDEEMRELVEGRIDIAVGPIGITSSRARQLAFTQPYFNASLGILTLGEPPSMWERIRPFLSAAFAVVVAGLLLLLFLLGNLMWLFERRHNPGIPEEWSSGVANGMWMALVTMTTVGYGDRVPMTSPGRVVIGLWMIGATVMVSTLTASITTALTVSNLGTSNIKSAESLSGKRIAVVTDTVGETFASSFHATLLRTPTLHEAIDLVLQKRAEAVVYDEPSLRFYMRQHTQIDLTLLAASFDVQSFGYALPLNSPRVQDINIALLALAEAGTVRQLRELWFAANAAQMRDPTALQPVPTGVLPPAHEVNPEPTPAPQGSVTPSP